MTAPDRKLDDQAGASTIPGAWARPASAFADESSVVRPERQRDGGSRLVSLAVLGVLALGTAGFAWGVTVALRSLDEHQTGAVAKASPPAPRAAVVGDEQRDPPAAVASDRPATGDGAAADTEQPPVPAGDPTFPSLPEPTAEAADEEPTVTEDDIPAPKHIRLARAAASDDDKRRKQRMKRPARKGQQKLARKTTKDARAAKRQPAPKPEPEASTASAPPPTAPTAASLTREAEQLFSQGKLPEARAVAERALALSRGYPRAHRALAVICARQGDTACARKGYETYLKLAPSAPDAPDVRRILGM